MRLTPVSIALALLCLAAAPAAPPEEKPVDPYAALKYRFIGPPGNRTSAVAGVPGDPNTYYVGAASGGVWKSTDGGINWSPVFDEQSAQSVGSIAIAPSDPNVVWVGTGEPFIRSNVSLGDGIYKSTDAGKTWKRMGLEKTGRIPRIAIDPRNPDVVFAAAMGTCYGPQADRGVYRTMDGGKSWEKVLFVDENTGISDLSMDPVNPRVLFAGAWQIDIKTWGRKSGGSGSGLFVTRDGGTTWKRLTGNGLPEPPLGKIAVSVAPSDPRRVYALIETGQRGSLWRSDDGGEKWKRVNASRLLNERPHYYTRMLVMPDNANEVYFPSNGMGATYDGGDTSESIRWGGDNHDMWADPKDARRMMIGNDGGVLISTTRGRQWNRLRLPIGQMYHVAADNRVPYMVYGQMQDDGSMRGPSINPGGFGIPPAKWTTTAGCETGWATPDPVNPDVVWGGCYAGVVERWDAKTGMSRSVSVWPERTMGANAGQIKLRMNWTFPIAVSPHDHNTVYVGSQYVHATSDGGQTWKAISPDLTLNDPAMMGDSGGLTVDNLSVEYAGVVYTIAESPREKGVIWAGTNDGVVAVTRDAGANWSRTTSIPGLPPKGTVASVDPSPNQDGVCYIAVDLHQVDNRDPFLFKTTDYGKTWKSISSNIPKSQLSYAHIVREDPFRKGLLYAGTENALYVSFDDGGRWEPLQAKLPHAPVYWMLVQPTFHDLVVGTYGRGFYILDDVTPLEQLTDSIRAEAAHLFEPRSAWRFRSVSQAALAPVGTASGQNPAYGASLNYWLKDAVKAGEKKPVDPMSAASGADEKRPKGPVEIVITDASGQKVRTLRGTNTKGLNRVTWDLRYEPSQPVRLRTTPAGNPHVWEEKRFRGKDSRGVFYYGINAIRSGPLVPPGTYTVKLSVEGKEFSHKLVVKKDPNSAGSDADVESGTKLSMAIYRDTNTTAKMINQLEWSRRQVEDFKKMLTAEKAGADDTKAADEVEKKLRVVEDRLLQPTLAENDEKSFRGPLELYLKLLWLQAEVGSGAADVSGNADFPPTQPELEVYDLLSKTLADTRKQFDELYEKTIPSFNEAIRAKGYITLMTVKEPDETGVEIAPEPDEDPDS
ncbi:MAG TPA: sialidase [Thermoanaerobaculia bacterium]|nr:sialidase [Thermoanaerobaculia bacterium]